MLSPFLASRVTQHTTCLECFLSPSSPTIIKSEFAAHGDGNFSWQVLLNICLLLLLPLEKTIHCSTYLGYALLVQPHLLSQAISQLLGSWQAMLLGNNTRLIIPGITITNMGRIFKKPAKMVPALAWMWFLAPKARWTRTWIFRWQACLVKKSCPKTKISKVRWRQTSFFAVFLHLPSPYTASSQAFSVNAFWWRIRDERSDHLIPNA